VWLKEPRFKDMVKGKWNSYSGQGNSMFVFEDKLKCLKVDLKRWNRNVFGHLELGKKNVLKEIEELDGQDEDDALPESLRMRRLALFSRVEEINKKLESLFKQKAITNWFAFGDSNSKFYPLVIRWRRIRNEVKGVEMGGVWCEELEALKLYEAGFSTT